MIKVYVMCGLPFSGKTTLSKRIAEYDHAERVSFDELWVELEKSDPNFPKNGGVEGWEYVCARAEEKIEMLLKEGKDVVYDNLNGRKEHRDKIKAIADRFNALSIVVYLNTSLDEVRKREIENLSSGERHTVQYENFKNAIEQFEDMQQDEYFIVYNPKTPIDFWLDQFITDENIRLLDLYHLSLRNFKKFVSAICYLLLNKGYKFDFIIGAGNSGLVVAKFTELIYNQLGISTPPVLQIPILRYKGQQDVSDNLFDNSVLLPGIKQKLQDLHIDNISNILFVDDEIGLGITAKTCLKMIHEITNSTDFTFTVVAEDQGVQWEDNLPAKVEFYPFAQEWPELNNVIMWFSSGDIVNPIEDALPEVKGSHTVMNILLGLPTKEKGEHITMPSFTLRLNEEAQRVIPNLVELQENGLREINNLIKEGIEEWNHFHSGLLLPPRQISSEEIEKRPKSWTAAWSTRENTREIQLNYLDGKASGKILYFDKLPEEIQQYERKFQKVFKDDGKSVFICSFGDSIGYIPRPPKIDGKHVAYEIHERLKYRDQENNPKKITIDDVVSILKNNKVIFYTGAGISHYGGVLTMNGLNEALGIDMSKEVDSLVMQVLNDPNKTLQKFKDFCNSAFIGSPTPAHIALGKIAQKLRSQILTENFDLLQHRTGIAPFPVSSQKLLMEVDPKTLSEIDYIICIGLSRDDRGFLGWYRKYNPRGKIIALDLGMPSYLGINDFLVEGDLQSLLPELAEKLGF